MPAQNNEHKATQIGFRLSGWRAIAALGLLVALTAAIVAFALGLMIILAPILLVSSVAYYVFSAKRRHSVATKKSGTSEVIDGEFRVVENPNGDAIHHIIQIGSRHE